MATRSFRFGFITATLDVAPLHVADEGLFCRLFTDGPTMKFIGPPLSMEAARKRFRASLNANGRQPARDIYCSIRHMSCESPVGLFTLQRIDWDLLRAEIGIMIVPAKHGQGIGREVLAEATSVAFRDLGIHLLFGSYHPQNVAARRAFAGAGFSVAQDAVLPREDDNVEISSLTFQDWRTKRRRQ